MENLIPVFLLGLLIGGLFTWLIISSKMNKKAHDGIVELYIAAMRVETLPDIETVETDVARFQEYYKKIGKKMNNKEKSLMDRIYTALKSKRQILAA